MTQKLVSSLLGFVLPVLLSAQTVTWKMQPTDYDQITRLGKDLFLVGRNNQTGLIKADGTIIEGLNNCQLSGFYEHKALLTVNDDHGPCILGVLSDQGVYTPFKQKYYTLTGQAFFSDGLLSVEDEQKQRGYVDETGIAVLGFDGRFDRIKPFTEGYAAVYKNKAFSLINKAGQKVAFQFETVGDIAGGANIFQGKAYLFSSDGKFYIYDVNKGGYCKNFKMPSKDYSIDYLSRFACITGKNRDIPYTQASYTGAQGLTPSYSNSLYGWDIDNQNIVPHQFSTATPFIDGLSIVSLNGKNGILQYEMGKFSLSANKQQYDYGEGETVSCSFTLQAPDCWRTKGYKLRLSDENHKIYPLSTLGGVSTFKVTPTVGNKTFTVEVQGEGLLLYTSAMTFKFVKIPSCPTCHKRKDHCPYHGKHPAPATTKQAQTPKEKTKKKDEPCPDCGLPISKCPYGGVH